MDTFVERAVVVQRLNFFQMEKLHELEKKREALVYASVIRKMFTLNGTFRHWGIPESGRAVDISAREKHFARIRAEIVKAGCASTITENTDVTFVDVWHNYDKVVRRAVEQGLVDLPFRKGGSLLDEVEEIERMQQVAP